jgi:hypothetical protein
LAVRNRAALATIAVLTATASLRADVAVGAAAAMLDASFALGLAPAVFLIESIIAYRVFRGLGFGTPLLAVIIANLASSILGLILTSLAPLDMSFRSIRSGRQRDENTVALMALCLPFFVLSVVIEYAVARRLIPVNYQSRVWRWAMEANVVSYIMIEAVLLMTLWSIRSARSQGLISSIW